MRRSLIFVLILFSITLGTRLAYVWNTPHLDYDAYFQLRLIEHVAQTGLPLRFDPLSFGGHLLLLPPLFYYITALPFALFKSEFLIVALSQIFISLLTIVVFLTVKSLTSRDDAALLSSALASFVPVLFSKTIFSVSPLTVALPIVFLAIFTFIHCSSKKFLFGFISLLFISSLLHPSTIILILGLLLYLIISKLEKIKLGEAEFELIFFATFIFIWIQFLLYKTAFLSSGMGIIWQDIPSEVMSRYFEDVTISSALLQIGVFPLLGGVLCIYHYLLKIRNKHIYLYIALSTVVALCLFLRVIEPAFGFMYLGVCFSILTGPAYVVGLSYFHKTRLVRFVRPLAVLVIITIIFTTIAPLIYFTQTERASTIAPSIYSAFEWLADHTSTNSTVLAVLREGHLITHVAGRKNVVDDYFVLAPEPAERLQNSQKMFQLPFATPAAELFSKYGVDYILLSNNTRARYNISDLPYRQEPCIRQIYQRDNVFIYKSDCRVYTVGVKKP